MGGAGIHRFAVVARHCSADLNDRNQLVSVARSAAESSGIRVVGETAHAFVPHGLTVALLLAQSHLVISTWPEHDLATVDIVVCADPATAVEVWRRLHAHLRPATVEITEQAVSLVAG